MNNLISTNLKELRKARGYTQEEVAQLIGVSRQAVAKWESSDTVPDINNCLALAELYKTTLDELVSVPSKHEAEDQAHPKGKHIFGVVRMDEHGQIIIPKEARELFHIAVGDSLLILGDEAQGIAIVKNEQVLGFAKEILNAQRYKENA